MNGVEVKAQKTEVNTNNKTCICGEYNDGKLKSCKKCDTEANLEKNVIPKELPQEVKPQF